MSVSIHIPVAISCTFATKTNMQTNNICPPIHSRIPDEPPCYVRQCWAYAYIFFYLSRGAYGNCYYSYYY